MRFSALRFGAASAIGAVVAAGCSTGDPAGSSSSGAGVNGGGASVTTNPEADAGPPPTYHVDIAPLVSRHCSGCHVAGGLGPFALGSYADAFARHETIARVVGSREMPPWLPAEGCGTFRDSRSLAQADIDRIVRWSRAGAPEGEATNAPLPSPPPERRLEWVDRAPDIGVDYVPQFQDEWRCFSLDPGVTEDSMLLGYDLQPTVRGEVHHAGLLDADLAEMRAKDDEDPGGGWPCPGGIAVAGGRLLGSWAGGSGAVTFPEGSGIPFAKGRGIVLQIHYHMHDPSKPIADRTRIQLQFARGSVSKEASIAALSTTVGTIPPRTNGYSRTATYTLAEGGTIWALQPHMHLLGATVEARIRGEDGAAGCLLDVQRWNYHWETMHFFDTGRVVPPGTTVDVECTWNNPTDRPVTDGLGIDDEMCDLTMVVTP